MVKSILLVGVGGQGTILVSKILSQGFMDSGYDVKMSEIHGMSQRGGSVTTQIRFGDKVHSPSIGKGEADLIVSFEKLEAARYISQLKGEGTLIVNDIEIYPLPVLSGFATYPENIMEELQAKVKNLRLIEGSRIAEDLGSPRSQNMVLLGALAKELGLEDIDWIQIIKNHLPERFHDINIEAFNKGLAS